MKKSSIELLLQVAADFHEFCEPDTPFVTLSSPNDELSEFDLDFIAAAAKPTNIPLPDKNKT